MMGEVIDKTILSDEECARCIYSPFHYSESKNKLKREAFLPKVGGDCISLLRLRYCDYDYCINHGIKISNPPDKIFCVIAILTQNILTTLNEDFDTDELKASIVYSPMNGNDYVDTQIPVYENDANVSTPMHADMKYNRIVKIGEVQTQMRRYASELCKRIKYAKISDIKNGVWYQKAEFDKNNQ